MIFTPLTKSFTALELSKHAFEKCLHDINQDYEVKHYTSIMEIFKDAREGNLNDIDYAILLGIRTLADINTLFTRMKTLIIETHHFVKQDINSIPQGGLWAGLGTANEVVDPNAVGDIVKWKMLSLSNYHAHLHYYTDGINDTKNAEKAVSELFNNAPKSWFQTPIKHQKLVPQIINWSVEIHPLAVYGHLESPIPILTGKKAPK